MIYKTTIKNFKSIKNATIEFTRNIFVLAGQNESGKSSVLEALGVYEKEEFERDNLNFEEEQEDNLIQEISVYYKIDNIEEFVEVLISMLMDALDIDTSESFSKEGLLTIKNYSISKIYDFENDGLSVNLDKPTFEIVKSCMDSSILEIYDDISLYAGLSKAMFDASPQIILFNDFSDLLPDKILISDLEAKNKSAEGYQAVKNLESLLQKDFVSISKYKRVSQRTSYSSKEIDNLSITFQKDWKQKIYENNEVRISFQIENEDVNGIATPTVYFFVLTKDNVPLEPRKRSKGMIWFLSAWLDLKSSGKNGKLVVLYDEPGLYLHIKAHSDILGVFNNMIEEGHQVIYSTHSPSLINTNTLDNIGLVLNSSKKGTLVEGLTSSKINSNNKRDALQPVAEAMGLEPIKEFSILAEKNVILEGLSDFWYYKGMIKLLGLEVDYKFVPGIGIKDSKIFHLISFCIGYGLDWLLLMDGGELPTQTRESIKKNVFSDNEENTASKVKLIPFKEVEEMFTKSDLNLIDNKIKPTDKRSIMMIIGKKRKIIFSKRFFQKVESGEINNSNLSQEAQRSFREIFDWIEESF